MTKDRDIFSKLGTHFAAALEEVGTQLKYHAKQATREIGLDIDVLPTALCSRGTNPLSEVQCSLFGFNTGISSQSTTITISGEYKFKFDVKFDPQELGLIVVTVDDINVDECNFVWKRRLESYETILNHVNSTEYKLTADDVGSTVVVSCHSLTSNDVATGEIGPIDVDLRSKRLIQDALINNATQYQLYFIEGNRDEGELGEEVRNVGCELKEKYVTTASPMKSGTTSISTSPSTISHSMGGHLRRCTIYILMDEVKLQLEDGLSTVFKCRYTSNYPRVRLDVKDDLVFYLKISGDKELALRVYSRQQRDLIVLIIRVFHSRTLITNSLETNSLEISTNGALNNNVVNFKNFSLISMVQKLNTDLSFLMDENVKLKKELLHYKQEKTFLEAEIKNTIQVFQQQLSFLDDPKVKKSKSIDVKSVNDEMYLELINRNAILTEKLDKFENDNKALKDTNDTLCGEKNRLHKQSQCLARDLDKLKNDLAQLEKNNQDLKNKIRRLTAA